MKTPKYTDLHRYPNGWKPSTETNVTETWERAKREHERAKEREHAKVKPFRSIAERGSASPSSSLKSGTAGAGPFSSSRR